MATEIKKVLHMNEGSDETSYAKSSYIQKHVLSLTKAIKENAIREIYCKELPTTLCMADLGCSSAVHNTLNVMIDLINTVEKAARLAGKRGQEYQVYLNDLPGNDFNLIFRSLACFEDDLKKKVGVNYGHCFVHGVPGCFYGRLFPSNHLHFVHSSYGLHWLSQIPEGIEDNENNIYIARTSPPHVLKAYSDQFMKDFTSFLRCRSQEVVNGGMMIITVLGRKSLKLYSKQACYMWDLLAMALNDMLLQGLIEEEKLHTFNVPQYPPSETELRLLVEKEGSFTFNQAQVSYVNWEPMQNYNNSNKVSGHYDFFKCMRSVVEPLIKSHFGEFILEELFLRYWKKIQVSMENEKNVFINVTLSLTRKV
ncbi:S-adenosyl-L-methionine:benzoic acid/salicylic acid carboxyl methyltransferase 3-like [Amaranthus tricolor]|uniref:S-adenosyl-L-methionine:benzoic acid/salicylic acid carboxyl methyltransferase 3-like n=1 Tax=Amaranthus tricolor TaxID=29722 RepID=UPI002582F478|nr:S-adenosyl-L-methionine:benzoic acid/salicylic acid carboxyl methyltransferase 3-like [Amaranthus tricolor]